MHQNRGTPPGPRKISGRKNFGATIQVADEFKTETECTENAVGWKRRKIVGGSFVGVAPDKEEGIRHKGFLQRASETCWPEFAPLVAFEINTTSIPS